MEEGVLRLAALCRYLPRWLEWLPRVPSSHEHSHHSHEDGGNQEDHPHQTGEIEWEDDMVDVNRMTTPANMRWNLVDRETGAVNAAIDWRFRVGDRVKLRLVNEMDSDHPMHHRSTSTAQGASWCRLGTACPSRTTSGEGHRSPPNRGDGHILLDLTTSGRWIAHCHIAEHHESGMMFSFTVDAPDDPA